MHQRDYDGVFGGPTSTAFWCIRCISRTRFVRSHSTACWKPQHFKPQEVKLTEQLIQSLTEPFKPKQYHNEFQERLKKLIESKSDGKAIEVGETSKRAPVIDMMTALKKSLASSGAQKKSGAKPRKMLAARKAS